MDRAITRGRGRQQDGAPQQPCRARASHSSNNPGAGRARNSPPLIQNSELHSRVEEKATLSPAPNWSLCARLPRAGYISVKPQPLLAPARGHAQGPEPAALSRPFSCQALRLGPGPPGSELPHHSPPSRLPVDELQFPSQPEPPAGRVGRVK